MRDRDLLVVELKDGALRLNGEISERPRHDDVLNYFGLDPNQLAVILVGKDGTVKLREEHSVDPLAIFALIDTMPMRRAEMKRGG